MELKWLSVLRVFGLVLVLVYHFFPGFLGGGFLGVDIFFTFSGYLITSLLLYELSLNGGISLPAFYERRFRRLFPAVLFMLAVMLPASLLISPDLRVGIQRQAAAAAGWVSNYYEILSGSSYEANLLPHLFVHTWTLSVEVHYYLLWAAVVCAAGVLSKKITGGKLCPLGSAGGCGRGTSFALALAAVLGAAASWTLMQIFTWGAEPSHGYFATTSHIYPLLIGSLAGIAAGINGSGLISFLEDFGGVLSRKGAKIFSVTASALAAAVIVVLALLLKFEDAGSYRYGILLTSLLTAGIIILIRGMQSGINREPFWIRFIADRSFSMYLFHWPLYIIIGRIPRDIKGLPVFLKELISHNAVAAGAAAVLTLLFAHLSYEFVEKPFRKRAGGQETNRLSLGIAAAFIAVMLFISFWFVLRTAPSRTSIEQDYEHEALLLSVDDLYLIRSSLEGINLDPVADRSIARFSTRPPAGWMPVISNRSLDSDFGSITVIGDSILLGGGKTLRDYVGNAVIDAEGSRNIVQGAEMVLSLEKAGKLGDYVVLVLATNRIKDDSAAAEQIVKNIGPGRRIIFVTGHGNKNTLPLNAAYRDLALRYSYVTVADWDALISPYEYLLSTDNIHMGDPASKRMFAQCIVDALIKAKAKPSS